MKAPRFWLWALALVALLFVVARCSDAAQLPQLFKWEHRIDVPESIVVTIESVSATRLHNLQVKYGSRESAQAVSILHGRGDGQWSCEIFIGPTNDYAGAKAHELRHCNGWVHQ